MSDGEDEKVGYRKPPKKSRFQKGKSGNPSGRPKGARGKPKQSDFDEVILSEAYRTVEVTENGRVSKLEVFRAATRSLALKAARGDVKAQRVLLQEVRASEARQAALIEEAIKAHVEYQREWRASFRRCDEQKVPRPNPIPHPDDITFDAETRSIIYNGPVDDKDAAEWKNARECREELAEDILELQNQLKRTKGPAKREELQARIRVFEGIVQKYDAFYPDEKTRREPGFRLNEWRIRQWRLVELRQAEQERTASSQATEDC